MSPAGFRHAEWTLTITLAALEASPIDGVSCVAVGAVDVIRLDDLGGHLRPEERWASTLRSPSYQLARRARCEFGLDGQPIASTASLAHALGQDSRALRRATKPLELLSPLELVDGVVTQGVSGDVALGLRERGEAGMRFLLCRALGEVFYSRETRS